MSINLQRRNAKLLISDNAELIDNGANVKKHGKELYRKAKKAKNDELVKYLAKII